MANFVFPLGRVVSTDGSLTSAGTRVGDILYNQFTATLSLRAQDALGAPVEVAIPSIGGGSGTANRLVKFTGTGSMDDSNASDTGTVFQYGQVGQWRVVFSAVGNGFQLLDNVANVLLDVTGTGKMTVASDFVQNTGVTILTPLGGVGAAVIQASAGGQLARAADATALPYTAANPALWAGAAPTNVEDAIERIAAAVSGLLVGPIP